jgi:hypothetical protein
MARKKTAEQFILDAKCVHGERYDYSLVEYIDTHTKIKIGCPIHGIFEQTPCAHKRRQGCPGCTSSKRRHTWLEKYGVPHARQNSEVIAKQKHTNLEKYGTEYAISHPGIQETIKATNVERHGVNYPFQSTTIQSKKKSTNLMRYGHENIAHGTKKEKVKQTNLDRYGTEAISQRHMLDVIPLLNDPGWLIDQYLTQNKTATQISSELGVTGKTVLEYLRKSEIEIRTNFFVSYKSNQWLDSLQIPHLIHEWSIPGTRYKADGYDPETNTVYEFHGDYWHGNPDNQQQDKIFHGDVTFGDRYRTTKSKEEKIVSLGYNLVVIWESEYDISIKLI